MRLHIKTALTLILLVACAAIAPGDVEVQEDGSLCLASVCFPPKVEIGDSQVPVRNIAKLTYWGFSLHTSALYLPDHVANVPSSLGNEPMRFVLHYHRSFTREQINEATESNIAANPDANLEKLRPELDKAYLIHQDVEEGDEYSLTFVPKVGTTFFLNGKQTGFIAGDEFARAYFGIWLGNKPVSESFRDDLSQRRPQSGPDGSK